MKQLTFAMFFLIPIFLSGCFENSQVAEAKKIVSANLKDPDSATFRNISRTEHATCGEFNAKNSYGAYVGYKKFLVLKGNSMQYLVYGENIDTWKGTEKNLDTQDVLKTLEIHVKNLKAANAQFELTGKVPDQEVLDKLDSQDFFKFQWEKYCL